VSPGITRAMVLAVHPLSGKIVARDVVKLAAPVGAG
jgi:hypothetical protein